MKKIIFICFITLHHFLVIAQADHAQLNNLLFQYVEENGSINFESLKNETAAIERYLKNLSKNAPTKDWSVEDTKAYWINAYNALVLQAAVREFPFQSVSALSGGKLFSQKIFKIGLKSYSLDDIEHRILRPMGDPRIHFALCILTKTSPIFPNAAFNGQGLNSYLDFRTRQYLQTQAIWSEEKKQLSLPQIFEWYKEDFGDVITFVNQYRSNKIATSTQVKFIEYDWHLH